MTVITRKGRLPHIEWIDLKSNRVLIECAVMKRDEFGNIYYIDVTTLDKIDKQRLGLILSSRHSTSFPLWDLMAQQNLNNGMNALVYFHQLVKVITPEGVVMNPRAGQVGVSGRIDLNDEAIAAQMGLEESAATAAKTTSKRGSKSAE